MLLRDSNESVDEAENKDEWAGEQGNERKWTIVIIADTAPKVIFCRVTLDSRGVLLILDFHVDARLGPSFYSLALFSHSVVREWDR